MIIFDGVQLAARLETELKKKLAERAPAGPGQIASLVFHEDEGGRLYTQKKAEFGARLGIVLRPTLVSLRQPLAELVELVTELSRDPAVSGVLVQKPRRSVWLAEQPDWARATRIETRVIREAFADWWRALTVAIEPSKDVDGLSPQTQSAIRTGEWRASGYVLPATVRAVRLILAEAGLSREARLVILGKSDLLGEPLYHLLRQEGYEVTLLTRTAFTQRQVTGEGLKEFGVVVSATGQPRFLTADLLAEQVTLIDVGEPEPDFDFSSVQSKARFLTPVPGGVGPVTVASLFQNLLDLTHTVAH